jgi:hypothetical protein
VTGPIDQDRGGRPIKRRCVGHRKDGARCRRSANHGTTVCNSHGGAAAQVKVAAARREADAEAAAVMERWQPPQNGHAVDVLGELAALIATVTSFHRFATNQLGRLTAEEWAARDVRVEAQVRQFQVACGQAGRLLTGITRIGLAHLDAEAVARRHGEQVARAMDRTFDRLGFDYRPEAVRRVIAEEIRQIPADEERWP